MFDEIYMLDWAHKRIVELRTFASQILKKSQILDYYEQTTKSVPLAERQN